MYRQNFVQMLTTKQSSKKREALITYDHMAAHCGEERKDQRLDTSQELRNFFSNREPQVSGRPSKRPEPDRPPNHAFFSEEKN